MTKFENSFISDPEVRGGTKYYGEFLDLQSISREQMGAYLCIASNKIPPSVSKRITLVVECEFNFIRYLTYVAIIIENAATLLKLQQNK